MPRAARRGAAWRGAVRCGATPRDARPPARASSCSLRGTTSFERSLRHRRIQFTVPRSTPCIARSLLRSVAKVDSPSRGRPVTVRRNDRTTERTRVCLRPGSRVRKGENERSEGGHRPAGRFISESYGACFPVRARFPGPARVRRVRRA